MPRSTVAARREVMFDKELELRSYDATAIAATTSETAIEVPELAKQMEFCALVNVAAYTGTFAAGSLQWAIAIEVSTAPSSGFVSVGSVVPNGTQQEFKIPLSGDWIQQNKANAIYVRATATKTGAPGGLTYGAFLAPAY